MLFRGYGVSPGAWPVHAALVANDSLILLDEAHCARPFRQTVDAVVRYRSWAENGLVTGLPFFFVPLTGTPPADLSEEHILRDEQDDRDHAILGKRLNASKPTRLEVALRARGGWGAWRIGREEGEIHG